MVGRTLLTTNIINPTRVSADGSPQQKPGGITIDWSTVTAPGSDTTLVDGSVIRSGNKFLSFGQVMCKIGGGTNTLTGTASGGTATLTVTTTNPNGTTNSQTTAAISATATAAAIATAIGLLSNIGAGNVTGSGGAMGTNPVTLTFASFLGTVSVVVNGASLTGGTWTAGASLGTPGAGADNQGMYGPYDPAAADGRQTLTRGECYVMDFTVLQYNVASTISPQNDIVGDAIEGGLIWIDRVIQSGTATHTLAAGPTKAEFLAAFPNFRIVEN
jgi:hypothetical protein